MHQTAREKGCLKYLNMLAKFLDVMGAEYQWFDKDEVAKRLGTDSISMHCINLVLSLSIHLRL